ncbi:hypothetical protein HJC23_008234 [Cyclotella cryptica]|uniref:Nucleotide-diphospho-sugar transferase domain-containing protein n=1 Tax=Cyclotella cryptica TaxID=29204 RepID=A0ABD3Q5X2_9STRA
MLLIFNVVPFNIPYGGFGTILNKAAIQQLSEPINCSGGSSEHQSVCAQIDENRIGEAGIFKDGMTLFELFYLYSSVENFCFHSDWLVGYVLEFYIKNPDFEPVVDKPASRLVGMLTYPSCGNMTVTTGATRPCTRNSKTCHNLDPHDMEALSLFSFVKAQSDYDAIPMLASTNLHQALDIIAKYGASDDNELGGPGGGKEKGFSWRSGAQRGGFFFFFFFGRGRPALLQAENAVVKRIEPVRYALDVPHFEPWFVDIALAKLRAFELTEYERVQVLDADSFVKDVDQLDKLFTSFLDAKLVAEGLGADSPLRAGWLLIQPSEVDFEEMQQILNRGVFDDDNGWDSLDLPVEYPGWISERKLAGNWEFYGSQLEQGKSLRCCFGIVLNKYSLTSFSSLLLSKAYCFTTSMPYPRGKTHWQEIQTYSFFWMTTPSIHMASFTFMEIESLGFTTVMLPPHHNFPSRENGG